MRLPASILLAVLLPTAAQAASALDLFYERTVMSAADQRCRLFSPSLASALNAARVQARGAAMRAGTQGKVLTEVEQRAFGKVRTVDCKSKDVTLAADRVRGAFDGFQRMTSMTYPGDMASWKAERSISRHMATWGLYQTASFGWDKASVGLIGGQGSLTAVGSFADGARPYSARLIMRDQARTTGAYLDRRSADAAGRLPLASRLPPASGTQTFNAEVKTEAPVGLLPKGAQTGVAFRFSKAAAEAMANLDPREAVAIDFVIAGRGGDTVRRAYIEVGDFAAGRAFVQLALY